VTRFVLRGVLILAFVAWTVPAQSAEQAADDKPAQNDCETRIQKLDASQVEGEERLREKYRVIDYCAEQYKKDKTIARLVEECAKYVEQPVVKQQFAAECMLAAFNYANALNALKAEYGK